MWAAPPPCLTESPHQSVPRTCYKQGIASRTNSHDDSAHNRTCKMVHHSGFSSSACSLCSGITPAMRPNTLSQIHGVMRINCKVGPPHVLSKFFKQVTSSYSHDADDHRWVEDVEHAPYGMREFLLSHMTASW